MRRSLTRVSDFKDEKSAGKMLGGKTGDLVSCFREHGLLPPRPAIPADNPQTLSATAGNEPTLTGKFGVTFPK